MNESTASHPVLVVTHRDASGKPKLMWQENRLHRWLMERGYYSPKWPKIPLLLGRWQTYKEIEL